MNTINDVREKAKSLWIKSMKLIGNTAANIANSTRYKVDEVTVQNRRREIMNDIAYKAYALWLKGEPFPEQMDKLLNELKQLDEQLNDMRAAKYDLSVNQNNPEDKDTVYECGFSHEEDEKETETYILSDHSGVRKEINELFDKQPAINRNAEKMNASLNQLSDNMLGFSQDKDDK